MDNNYLDLGLNKSGFVCTSLWQTCVETSSSFLHAIPSLACVLFFNVTGTVSGGIN
jgi:hypothetical protein